MTKKTTDGKRTVTTIEQEGNLAGQAAGRVWIIHNDTRGASRKCWIGFGSINQAANFCRHAATLTAEELDAEYAAA